MGLRSLDEGRNVGAEGSEHVLILDDAIPRPRAGPDDALDRVRGDDSLQEFLALDALEQSLNGPPV